MFDISPRSIELRKVISANTDAITISVLLDFFPNPDPLRIGSAKGAVGTVNIKVFDSTGVQIHDFTDTSVDGSPWNFAVFEFARPTKINVDKNESPLNDFVLGQNYPNPFNPNTTIEYTVESNDVVQIKIYDELGQLVRNLLNERKIPGKYKTVWDGTDNSGKRLSSGTYFYQLKIGIKSEAKKMILLK